MESQRTRGQDPSQSPRAAEPDSLINIRTRACFPLLIKNALVSCGAAADGWGVMGATALRYREQTSLSPCRRNWAEAVFVRWSGAAVVPAAEGPVGMVDQDTVVSSGQHPRFQWA